MPMTMNPPRFCQVCSGPLVRKRFANSLEDRSRFLKRQHCGRSCMARAMVQEDDKITRSAHQTRARKLRGLVCNRCGSTTDLSIHHENRVWTDHRPQNLTTLCSSCHTTLHHEAGDISPARPSVPCRVCSRRSRKNGLCAFHAQRMKKHGDPLLTMRNIGGSWKLVSDVNRAGYMPLHRKNSTSSATGVSPRRLRSPSRSSGSDSTEQLSLFEAKDHDEQ